MKDWLGKPLLVVAVILLVLAAFSVYWLSTGPESVQAGISGSDSAPPTPYHRQLEQALRDANLGR